LTPGVGVPLSVPFYLGNDLRVAVWLHTLTLLKALLSSGGNVVSKGAAHLNGDRRDADALFREANMAEVWHWTNPAQGPSPVRLLETLLHGRQGEPAHLRA
jgi:hypothetical protein